MSLRIADRWFERRRIDDDITLLWEPHVVPLMRCNIWHVRGRDRDLLIDTGMGLASLKEAARDLLGKPVTAVATHAHADHIGGHHEFEDCLAHRLEAPGLRHPDADHTLAGEEFDARNLGTLTIPQIEGEEICGPLVTALPTAGYDLAEFRLKPAARVREVEDGDVVETGDRAFEVLHLPGHSPGGIGLWEAATGTLFSGDAVYDAGLIDTLHHSSVPDYLRTMRRLRALPVHVVHAGHCPSFGRERLIEITEAYLRARDGEGG